MALTLPTAKYEVLQIAVRQGSGSLRHAASLARRVKGRLVTLGDEPLHGDVVWITVPDDEIAGVAARLADTQPWKGQVVFHSSGALSSRELTALHERGAKVASVHPMMTFVRGSVPQMAGIAFAIEGDAAAVKVAKSVVGRLGGNAFVIRPQNKVLYHAFGSFASPLVVALMSAMERVAVAAGIRKSDIKPIMLPLLWQTLKNYLKHDGAKAFSGPLIRGDIATIRKHLNELKKVPEARVAYVALARAAVKNLPVKNRAKLEMELKRP